MANSVQKLDYRQQDLLSKNSFISYCRKYGIETSSSEIEKLMELGLLVPVMVQEGINNSSSCVYIKTQFFLLKMLKSEPEILSTNTKEKVEEYNHFLSFLHELFTLHLQYKSEIRMRVEKSTKIIKETNGESRFSKSDLTEITKDVGDEYKLKITKLLEKYQYRLDDIEKWRIIILGIGVNRLSVSIQELESYYYRDLNEEILKKIFDPYQFVVPLNWTRFLFIGMKKYADDGMNSFSDIKQCPYCLNYYVPTRSDNTNCGSKNCRNLHGKELRKRWYQQKL